MTSKYNVSFNEAEHKYWLEDGRELSGITSRLGKSIFFHGKFDKIPKHILENKRIHGSNVHKQIELYDKGEPYIPIKEVLSYGKLKKKHGIVSAANEVLVTDGHTYATAIDMVDIDINLYDHKTSYTLDKEYLSWQLSIGAFLYGITYDDEPKELFAIHYDKNGDCELISIDRKTDEEVCNMLYTDKYMWKPEMPSIAEETSLVKIDESVAERITYLEDTITAMNSELENLVNGIGTKMHEHGIDKVEFGRIAITVSKPYERESLDTTALKKEHPEIAKKFMKSTQVKSSVKLKVKSL